MSSTAKNTSAKELITKFDFSTEGSHLAYCINDMGGNAIQNNEAYLLKADKSELTENQVTILNEIKKAEMEVTVVEIEDLSSTLRDALLSKITALVPMSYISVWVDAVSSTEVIYTVDWYKTYKVSYSVSEEGVVTFGDDTVELEEKYVYIKKEDSDMEINKSSVSKDNYAHTPSEDPTSWKYRSDTKNDLNFSIKKFAEDSELSEEDKLSVLEKLKESHTRICPNEELPEVIKSFGSDTSDAASDGNTPLEIEKNNMPSGINDIEKKKDDMTDKKVVNQDEAFEAMQKSLDSITKKLEVAEKEAEDLKKAAAEKEVSDIKKGFTEVIKAYNVEKEEEVVEALFKSGNAKVLLDVMEGLHSELEKAKKDFGETEHGQDGDVIVKSQNETAQDLVGEILQKRAEARNSTAK